MKAGEKIFLRPASVNEAISTAKKYEKSFRFLAGGTDVIVNKFQGNDEAACLIDITGIAELRAVLKDENYLKIGALVRLDDLKKHADIKNEFPALLEVAHAVASPMLRKTATLGGNLLCENRCVFYNQSAWWREAVGYCLKCEGDVCIATGGKKNCFSKFVSDTAPVLIALNAQLEITDMNGSAIVPLESIYTGDGLNPRNISKTGMIRSVCLPLGMQYRAVFKKLRPREAVDFTSLTTAVSVDKKGRARIVLGGVDPKPVLVEGITSDLAGLIKQAVKKARIVDNDFYSRTYRKEMITVFLERSIEELNLKKS